MHFAINFKNIFSLIINLCICYVCGYIQAVNYYQRLNMFVEMFNET